MQNGNKRVTIWLQKAMSAFFLLFLLLRPAFFFLWGFFPAFPSSSPRFLLPPGLFHFFFFSFAPLSSFSGAFSLLFLLLRPAFFFLRGFSLLFLLLRPAFFFLRGFFTSFSSPSPRFLLSAGLFPFFLLLFAPPDIIHFISSRVHTFPPLRSASSPRACRTPALTNKRRGFFDVHNTLCTSKKPLLLFYHCLIGLPPTPLSHC